ncbi:MAG: peptidoglycan editing factor PgeF [Prevotella sp.]|nr:peptidoglycan editing factor PgeF [Prevotella sp.]
MSSPQLTYYDVGVGVVAFSTTRQGGCSTGNYAAFNINHYCGDDEAHIAENRRALAACIGVAERAIVMPHQTHGKVVRRVDEPPTEVIEGVDAVMTDVRGLCIGVSTADCIPILLYDAQHQAVAAVHAGWRGTVQRIVQETVRAMQEAYGTQAAQLKAVIGPGISLKNFEVGEEVYQQFAEAQFDMKQIARRYKKWHIDLPQCNRLQLEEMGVTDVQMSGICTYEQYETYFSARRLGIDSGRIYTAIVIK